MLGEGGEQTRGWQNVLVCTVYTVQTIVLVLVNFIPVLVALMYKHELVQWPRGRNKAMPMRKALQPIKKLKLISWVHHIEEGWKQKERQRLSRLFGGQLSILTRSS